MENQSLKQFNGSQVVSAISSSNNTEKLSKLMKANDAANKVFRACLDFDKLTEGIVVSVTEYLATLPPDMLARVCSVTEGVLTKTKYIPVVADFAACVHEIEARDAKYKPVPPSGYVYLKPGAESEPTPDQRHRMIEKWEAVRATLKVNIKPSPGKDADELKSSDDLKTHPGPPSRQLLELLYEQGGVPTEYPTQQENHG